MNIRDVRDEDFAAIAAITNHYILNTAIHFGAQPQTADELRTLWHTTQLLGPHSFLVMEDDSKPDRPVIAYAKSGLWRERAAYARTAEIGIYVHAKHHGNGLGKQLYAALIQRCRAATPKFHALVGGITLPNPASERLHESLGFERVGVFREVGFKFGTWHDVVFYELVLSEPGR